VKGPEGRGKVGLGFSQFRENWCPTCEETFPTEATCALPSVCRICGSPMPKKLTSPVGEEGFAYLKRRRELHQPSKTSKTSKTSKKSKKPKKPKRP